MSDSPSTPVPFDALEVIRNEGVELLGVLQGHDPATPVPSCPGWTLDELAWHQGEAWAFWARMVDEHVTDVQTVRDMDEFVRPSGDALLDWVAASHTAIYGALVDAPPEQEVWTWTGANRDAAWVRRRMAHETVVHSWDASRAVRLPDDIDPVVASDGIDEYLMWFAGRGGGAGAEPVGGTVHLHCIDTAGEWLVTALDASGATFTREHAKGDCAVRGRAGDLVLWLWGRDAGPVEVIGDATVAARFRAFSDLD
jgi:uncharacterized protein (TIGR03083 family)